MSSTSLSRDVAYAYKLFIYLNAGYRSHYDLLDVRSRFAGATDPRALARAQQIVACVEEWTDLLLAGQLRIRDADGKLEPVSAQALNLGRLLGDELWQTAARVLETRAMTQSAATRESAWPVVEALVWDAEFNRALQPLLRDLAERTEGVVDESLWQTAGALIAEQQRVTESILDQYVGSSLPAKGAPAQLLRRSAPLPGALRMKAVDVGATIGGVRGRLATPDLRIPELEWPQWEAVRLTPDLAAAWRAFGFVPEQARRWTEAGIAPGDAHAYACLGYELEDALELHRQGIAPEEAPYLT